MWRLRASACITLLTGLENKPTKAVMVIPAQRGGVGRSMAPSTPWHAVEVLCAGDGCAGAAACRGKRFLSADTPRLPLPDCDRAQACSCRYKHHADRRAGPRRASEAGRAPRTGRPSIDLRLRRGRRASDLA